MGRNNIKKYLIVVFIIAVVYLGNRFLLKNYLQDLVYTIARGPGTFFSQKFEKASQYGKALFERSAIISEDEELKKENLALSGQLSTLGSVERENDALRSQLGVSARKNQQFVLANIFSVDRSGLSSTIMIDKGARDGIKRSMAVIAGGNVLAGIIGEVFDDHSKVILLDDPRSSVSVRIGGQGVIGNARGIASQNGKVVLDLVTDTDQVQEGDLVVTSGLDNVPESLLVGRVDKVELKGGNLFKNVEASMLFDLSLGSNLFVILN
jgi:rod shape-determining protein MreC